MDEYIKKQDLIDWCNETYQKQTKIQGKEYCNAFLQAVVMAPTADVVPKSEPERLVDRWIGSGELTPDEKTLRLIEALRDEAKRYERYYFNHEYDKLIGEAKAEGAREAIEEIEREITKFGILPNNCAIVSLDTIAELKKKFEEK